MDLRKEPPPKRSSFQALPSELLHLIFSHLPVEDIFALRKTCSVLATVGLDYLGDEVTLAFTRDKFKALTEIAEHPKLSKQMRSLFYACDRCPLESYEDWDSHRPDPRPWRVGDMDRLNEAYQAQDVEAMERRSREMSAERRERLAAVPENDRRAAYTNFTALCQDQIDVEREEYDRQCLRVLFQGCTNIHEVAIASDVGQRRVLKASRKAFADAMASGMSGDKHWRIAAVRQVLSVAIATHTAGTRLDGLTLWRVSPLLFDRFNGVGEDEWHALRALVQPLRRLRLFICCEPRDDDENLEFHPEVRKFQTQAEQVIRKGHLRDILSAASDLRELKLDLPRGNGWSIDWRLESPRLRLEDALGPTTYSHLYEMSLRACQVGTEYLIDLCLRHKATLRRLKLSNIELLGPGETDWKYVLTKLSGQLPKLRIFKLSGTLDEFDGDAIELQEPPPWKIAPYKDALENFVVKGGDFPTTEDPEEEWYRNENPDWVPSGLPDDDKEADDPTLVYNPDVFDDLFS
jgi:hypothetical protein